MILVGLTGPKRSGKDAAFKVIEKMAEERGVLAVRRAFADKVKLAAARVFFPDISMEKAIAWGDEVKESDYSVISLSTSATLGGRLIVTMSGREYLQRFATEAGRDIHGEDIWLDSILPPGALASVISIDVFGGADIGVITDVRFNNEAERIGTIGGVVIGIERPGYDSDSHVSESGVAPFLIDYSIVNDGTLEEFESKVREVFSGILDIDNAKLGEK